MLELPESGALVEIIFKGGARTRAVRPSMVCVAAAGTLVSDKTVPELLAKRLVLVQLVHIVVWLAVLLGKGTLVVQSLECGTCEWFALDRDKRLCSDSASRFGLLIGWIFRSFFIGRNFLFRFRSRLLRRGGREFCQFHHPLRQGVGEYGALTESFEGGGVDGGEGGLEGGELVAVATVERGHLLIRRDLECHPFVVGNEVGHKR